MTEEYLTYGHRIEQYIADTSALAQRCLDDGGTVLFEGAQATMLDIDHGTYPFVTSSNPVAGAACVGAGVGPRDIDEIWGVAKAYATRVGAGPFPTELDDEVGEDIRQRGGEFGTTTGRARRTGWLDLVALRYAARLNTLTGLVITKLDVLQRLRRASASARATAATRRRRSTRFPYHQSVLHHATGEYDELPGLERGPHRVPLAGGPAAGRARLPRLHRRLHRRADRRSSASAPAASRSSGREARRPPRRRRGLSALRAQRLVEHDALAAAQHPQRERDRRQHRAPRPARSGR